MQKLTPEGQNLVNDLSNRYNLHRDTVLYMIGAVNNGGGTMAQFNSPELGGSGQWMRGGMTMVGDMFNNSLKNTVNNLCGEISNALANTQIFPIAPAGTKESNQWWPTHLNLGAPFSTGGQNNTRYAVFAKRLAVELNGEVTVYDTLDNNISGVSQQQGGDTSLCFTSQYGTISVSSLAIIYGVNNIQNVVKSNFANESKMEESSFNKPLINFQNAQQIDDIVEIIEKISRLHNSGILSDEEFNAKKAELLGRI